MPFLYNCRHSGDEYRITKFDSHFNLEGDSSYTCTISECTCPAGHRPKCRHREMLPKFINRGYVGTNFFFDYDRGGWMQGPMIYDYSEEDCPEHVASDSDPKVCGRCGAHIDSLRPEEEVERRLPAKSEGSPELQSALDTIMKPGFGEPSLTGEALPFQPEHPLPPDLVPTFLSPTLYEAAKAAGHDMRLYQRQELIPIESLPSLEGISFHSLNDPLTLYNAVADAVGEPRIEPSTSPKSTTTIRRRV